VVRRNATDSFNSVFKVNKLTPSIPQMSLDH
jgi:hypothetical protein